MCYILVQRNITIKKKRTPYKSTTCKRFACSSGVEHCGTNGTENFCCASASTSCATASSVATIMKEIMTQNADKEKARRSGLCDNLLSLVNNCQSGIECRDCGTHVKRGGFGFLACFDQCGNFLIQTCLQITWCGFGFFGGKRIFCNT